MTSMTGMTHRASTPATGGRSEPTRVLVLPVGGVLPWAVWRALFVAGAALLAATLAAALVATLLLGVGGFADSPLGPGSVPIPRPAGF